jgi:hypothetical protein
LRTLRDAWPPHLPLGLSLQIPTGRRREPQKDRMLRRFEPLAPQPAPRFMSRNEAPTVD